MTVCVTLKVKIFFLPKMLHQSCQLHFVLLQSQRIYQLTARRKLSV